MRIIKLIVFLSISFTSFFLSGEALGDTYPQNNQDDLEDCSAYSQAGMRDCLVDKVHASEKELKQIEVNVFTTITKWDEDEKYIKAANLNFDSSSKEFKNYREIYCKFAASLRGGAAGNSSDISRLACIFELNKKYSEQLKTIVSGLPLKAK